MTQIQVRKDRQNQPDRNQPDRTGVLLMTYGSPETVDDVAAYLTRIRAGKRPPDDLVEEFRRRYETIGGSPLTRITYDQAEALAAHLNQEAAGEGNRQRIYVPYVGMRYYDPLIQDTLKQMEEDGIDQAVGVIMSPQYSPILMEGYLSAVRSYSDEISFDITIPKTWWQEPLFQQAMAQRVKQALERVPDEKRSRVPLLLTAHSIPRRVYDNDPGYVEQLKATARAIGDLIDHHWEFAYQSAGHTQEEWLRPDLSDVFPRLAQAGHEYVVVAPIQFLADHLEILYDIDVAARDQADRQGLEMIRTTSLNTDETFIRALGRVVKSSLKDPVEEGSQHGR